MDNIYINIFFQHEFVDVLSISQDWKKLHYICKKSFSVPCNLKVHVQNVHKETKDVHCDKCNASFKSDFALRSHTKLKHSGKALTYKCNLCEKEFVTRSNLSIHCKRIHVNNISSCPNCDKTFLTPEWLERHIKVEHQNYIRCKTCEKIFPDKYELEIHQKLHKEEDTKCVHCGQKFASIQHKRLHVKKSHEDYIGCNSCKKLFSDNEMLMIHQETH